jgi:hypothetical protein
MLDMGHITWGIHVSKCQIGVGPTAYASEEGEVVPGGSDFKISIDRLNDISSELSLLY